MGDPAVDDDAAPADAQNGSAAKSSRDVVNRVYMVDCFVSLDTDRVEIGLASVLVGKLVVTSVAAAINEDDRWQ